MQKLLYITTNLNNSGGVSRILSVKLNYLIQEFGYQIHVINTTESSNSPFYHFNKKIQISSLEKSNYNFINLLTYRRKLKKAVNNISPDVIINCDNGLKGALLPYIIKTKVPLIYERHCSKDIKIKGLLNKVKFIAGNFVLSSSINKYNEFIVLNELESKSWNHKCVKIIPNGLWYDLPSNRNFFFDNVIIAVGRQSYEKGYDILLNIWKTIIKKHPRMVLKIYGDKNNDLKLESIAKQLKISKSIEFCSPVKDIHSIYSNAFMLLNTSRSEAFGLSIIEAMSFGLPVIAFENTSGTKSIIKNGENGFLIKKNDLNDYANKVILMIEDKKEMHRISREARESIKKFDLQKIMKEWHRLFQSFHLDKLS